MYFFHQYHEHTHINTHSPFMSPSPPPNPTAPSLLPLSTALTLDLLTLCLVSGSVRVWCWWHHPSQWVHCHLQLYCPLSALQWAALFSRRTALAWHAPSINDERERESSAESMGLVWPTALDAELIGRRLSPLTVTSVICGDKKEERMCLMSRFE